MFSIDDLNKLDDESCKMLITDLLRLITIENKLVNIIRRKRQVLFSSSTTSYNNSNLWANSTSFEH